MFNRFMLCIIAVTAIVSCENQSESETPKLVVEAIESITEIATASADGVSVFGEQYLGELGEDAPLIHLFHQGGGDGRGEYAPLVGWLNDNGFRAIAWNLRAGGDTFGGVNRTAASVTDQPAGYCDAYADVEAAIRHGEAIAGDALVITWGSSYSGALVFQAAAKNADLVDGVIAFSPASGGPLAECRARDYLGDVRAPAFVLRPASEMERESSQEQRDIFETADVKFAVVENGVHGSSMLVDERTEHNMESARALVMNWLNSIAKEQR